MKKLIVILIILVLIFGALSAWAVNVYAKPLDIGDLKVVVVPDEAGVFLKSGAGEFQKVTGETDLKVGDTVKTDETGSARIVLYDTNEVTLDKNSEVVIEESFIDEETPFLTKIKLNLKEGQIWNRLLELLHPDAYFEVESGGVVATVRGTIFNMSNIDGDIGVAVLENSVALTQVGETEAAQTLRTDEELMFNLEKIKDLREAKIEKIKEAAREGKWFKNNFLRDEKFLEILKEKKDALYNQVGPLPGERFYPAKQLGEKISLLLTFDKAERREKMENFEARKIFAAQLLAEQGNKAGALKIMKSMPNLAMTALAKRLGYYDRDFLKMQAGVLKSNIADGEFAKAYLKILGPKEFEILNRKVEAGGFLPEWLKAIMKSGPEGSAEAYPYLNLTAEDWACLGKIQTKSLEMQKMVEGASPEELVQKSMILSQMYTPEDFACIQAIQAKFILPKTEDLIVQPLDMQNTNVLPPPAETPVPVSLEITPSPAAIVPQATSNLVTILVWSDGTREDVTADTVWTVSKAPTGAPMGSVVGGIFYSSGAEGVVYLTGHYDTPDNSPFEASAEIQVAASAR